VALLGNPEKQLHRQLGTEADQAAMQDLQAGNLRPTSGMETLRSAAEMRGETRRRESSAGGGRAAPVAGDRSTAAVGIEGTLSPPCRPGNDEGGAGGDTDSFFLFLFLPSEVGVRAVA
jgi:hypothetical protein